MAGIPRLDPGDLRDLALRVFKGEVYLVPASDGRAIQSSFAILLMAELSIDQIEDLGAVWEETHKRIPGLGINGRPVFMSCKLLSHDDFAELDRLVRAMEFAALGVS